MKPVPLLLSTKAVTERLPDFARTIYPWWGCADCHQSTPYFTLALAKFSERSMPWSCWVQKWDCLTYSYTVLPLSSFLIVEVMFSFVQWSGNFTRIPQLLKYDGWWLNNFISCFPWRLILISSDLMDLYAFRLLSYLEAHLLPQRVVVHSPRLCLYPSNLGGVADNFGGEDWGKKNAEYAPRDTFSMSWKNRSSTSYQRRATFSLVTNLPCNHRRYSFCLCPHPSWNFFNIIQLSWLLLPSQAESWRDQNLLSWILGWLPCCVFSLLP